MTRVLQLLRSLSLGLLTLVFCILATRGAAIYGFGVAESNEVSSQYQDFRLWDSAYQQSLPIGGSLSPFIHEG